MTSGMETDVLADVAKLGEAFTHHADAVTRFCHSVDERFQTEERLIAEIRDELHEALTALSNRIEAVSRGN